MALWNQLVFQTRLLRKSRRAMLDDEDGNLLCHDSIRLRLPCFGLGGLSVPGALRQLKWGGCSTRRGNKFQQVLVGRAQGEGGAASLAGNTALHFHE